MNAKTILIASLPIAAALIVGCSGTDTPTSPDKRNATNPNSQTLTVGFSQIGAESGWRTANTESIKSEAEARGINLKFSDAQQKQENQIKAIRSFIDQKVDVIAFAPVVETGWEPVLREAKDAGIPVFVSDRRPDVPEDLYVTFIGSDFVLEGQKTAEWLVKATNGKAVIAELEGTTGSSPANDRKKGFDDVIAKNPGMQIVYSQSADFNRSKGKEVTEALLKSPKGKDINVIYAHNDEMALGAIQAIEAAGKKPGVDIMIVSIDGVKDGMQALVDGKINYICECNPLLGPILFDSIEKFRKGEEIPKWQVIPDEEFDSESAAKVLSDRKY